MTLARLLDRKVTKEIREQQDLQALQEIQVLLDLLVLKVRLVLQVLKAMLDRQEPLGIQDLRETLALQVQTPQ
jgi:hypothetical protein